MGNFCSAHYPFYVNLHVRAKFGPDRTTDGDVYTLGKNHATHTDTHTLSYIDIDRGRSVAMWTFTGRVFHAAQRPPPVERAPAQCSLFYRGYM